MSEGSRVCVGLMGGETCALSSDMELVTDRGPIEAENLKKLWREGFFAWVEFPTLMGVTKEADHEWEENEKTAVRCELTVQREGIAYVAEETGRE